MVTSHTNGPFSKEAVKDLLSVAAKWFAANKLAQDEIKAQDKPFSPRRNVLNVVLLRSCALPLMGAQLA